MRPGIFEEKSNNHLKEVTVKIRERYRASTYAQLEETASGDSNRVKEKRFLSFIALGNAVLADEFLARAYNKQESFRFGVMSTSSIQQARYATVASVTLFCRTAIDNGLPENLAYSISDSYLLHLDETESIEEIQFLSLSAFREYCQVMQDWRLQSCRKEIKQCCEYILMHIHEPISLTELAELVNLSPNHLSALFLKETSFRPTEYIRAQKLNYARYILDNYSPTIATLANLEAGIPLCPPEGDAGTGMAATNSVRVRTGNVSAGTSVFAMIVLEKNLSKVYPEIDMVTTPSGHPVAMVHCQNCTSDLNAWVNLFREFAQTFGMEISTNDLFGKLYNKALEGDADCGGLLAYNYFSGEHVTGFNEGRPVFARTPDAKFNLANFMRVNLFTSLGALKVGLDILMKEEHVQVDQILGHGGLFKTKGVGQKILAGAIDAPVSVMETAGEGGAWGIALLASYMINKEENETLEDYLDAKVFAGNAGTKMDPDPADVAGFEVFTERYKKGLPIERAAVESLK